MAILGFELEEIARLLALFEAEQWSDFTFEEDGRYLRIRGASEVEVAPLRKVSRPSAAPPAAAEAPSKQAILPKGQVVLLSPMLGIYYRAESPGATPIVQVGQRIEIGQTIGIIEAMKIFSEIPAESAGVIVAVLVQDGQMVQGGTPLMIVQSSP